jgi:chemotaxis methyl-accepting protein methylase
VQDALPSTKLDDDAYDLVLCTDVIGYLNSKDYRLLMAELSRLVKRTGHVVCSTAIDINSEDALQRFGSLAETEFEIEEWQFSYHLLLLRLKRFFEAPAQYVNAAKAAEMRKQGLSQRQGLSHLWYKLNTSQPAKWLWQPIKWFFNPVNYFLRQSQGLMIFLEKICKFFWSESGISHAIFLGKRRAFVIPTKADLESRELKGKRQVWE